MPGSVSCIRLINAHVYRDIWWPGRDSGCQNDDGLFCSHLYQLILTTDQPSVVTWRQAHNIGVCCQNDEIWCSEHFFYIIHLKIKNWNIKRVLCVWSSNRYVPSASQVTRMVSSSLSQCAIEGAWPGPIVAITHPLWHRRPTPGVECPQGLTTSTHWPPGRLQPDGHQSAGQTQHLIMPSRNTSKDSSSALCCLPPFLCYLNLKFFFIEIYFFCTHQTRLWLSFTTKKPWNKDKVVKLVMAIVHCKTEIIDFAAIQN